MRTYVYVIEFSAHQFCLLCLILSEWACNNGHVFPSLTYPPAFVSLCVCMFSSSPAMPTSQTCCLTQTSAIWAVWSVWSAAALTLWPMAVEPTVRPPRGWPNASITSRASNAVMWPDTWARSEHAHTDAHT